MNGKRETEDKEMELKKIKNQDCFHKFESGKN